MLDPNRLIRCRRLGRQSMLLGAWSNASRRMLETTRRERRNRMTNESNRREDQKKMVLCASCAGIQRNWRRAPGHAELVQMSSRKAERSDGDSGGHTVTITSYRCDA